MAANDPSDSEDLTNDPLLRDAPTIEGFKVLDPAVLYQKLGTGGMGAVYRGRHYKLDLDVAVKCLKPELAAAEPEFVKRFEREARLCASIAHQNVVRVMDVQEKNGLHYLVMEFVRGETAAERVERKGPLAEREALAILFGAATGLAEAHARGIVHRDIKPENIMVSLEGRVKLADLGLAKSTGNIDHRSVSMPASRIMGTPQYMPPEQWETTDVTPAADIWALGASFYFLCAGRAGIPAEGTYLTVARRIQEQDYPSLRGQRSDLRPEVQALFERCVHRDPKQRFADARELLRALQPLVTAGEEALFDAATGTLERRAGAVTPPPRQTLLRIRAKIETGVAELEGDPDGTETVATKPHPGPGARTVPSPGNAATAAPAAPPRRSWLPMLAVLLLVGGLGGAYAAGWLPPKTPEPVWVSTLPVRTPPSVVGRADDKADPQRLAREALAVGERELATPDRIDAAIAQIERARELDPMLAAATPALAQALAKKVEQLAATDAAAALRLCQRAFTLQPDDSAIAARAAELRAALAPQLAAGMSVSQPSAGAFTNERRQLVRGTVAASNCQRVRVAMVSGTALPPAFPSAAVAATVTAGEFRAEVEFAADGIYQIWLEATDDLGVVATLPPRQIVVDTAPPRLSFNDVPKLTRASELTLAGVCVDLQGGELRIDDRALEVAADGTFTCAVPLLSEGETAVVAVAADALGNTAREQLVIVVDRTGPQVAWLGPDPALAQPPGSVIVNGSARDPAGVQQVSVNGKPATLEGASWQANVTIAGAAAGEAVVPTRVEVVATDRVGNASEALVQLLRPVASLAPVPVPNPTPIPTPIPLPVPNPTPTPEAPSAPKPIITGIGLTMVPIAAQTFRMGSPESEAGRKVDEVLHTATISQPFWIAETEVTRQQWRQVMNTEPWVGERGLLAGDEVAATHVTWLAAVEFCAKLTIQERVAGRLPTSHRYALPSEAEWELACRGGTATAFASGDDVAALRDFAVFGAQPDHAEVVKRRLPNDYGLFDMHGNVFEWCADFADLADGVITDTYRDGVVDPLCAQGARRVRRGGSWRVPSAACRSAARLAGGPAGGDVDMGLRPALVVIVPGR
jgi:formylglycine-generating enzyme required for sulfatase activity